MQRLHIFLSVSTLKAAYFVSQVAVEFIIKITIVRFNRLHSKISTHKSACTT